MLQRLIEHEIEGKPAAKQMKLAIIPGFNLLVPQGKLVGGDLQVDPALLAAGPDRMRPHLDQLPREECPAARRHLRLCRQARDDCRLHQSRPPRRERLGPAR